ncbi:MAG: pseudouridine synthase [Bacteroidia bacterium]
MPEDKEGKIGFLAAFSGRLGNTNRLPGFVPPVFDLLDEEGFFRQGEHEISQINQNITALEKNPEIEHLKMQLQHAQASSAEAIAKAKALMADDKKQRHHLRSQLDTNLPLTQQQEILKQLEQESRNSHRLYKHTVAVCRKTLNEAESALQQATAEIESLKKKRKEMSSALQEKLFDSYSFLDSHRNRRNLKSIFAEEPVGYPPSGAGECCAPRLLQYAFSQGLKPLSIAEFWWGDSPVTEIRHEGNFYPACRGKCAPILKHMLNGIELENEQALNGTSSELKPEIIFEDEWFLAIHKHENMLSVPGKLHEESLLQILRKQKAGWEQLIAAHRLDMSTSGILLFAKNLEAYRAVQALFISRQVKKRYVAILSSKPALNQGVVSLPLRADYFNRPRQMVCEKEGKPAITSFQVISDNKDGCRVHFYPETGRTHQLRVHAAHPLGLNAPIVGDDLYGFEGPRLMLHAEFLAFTHPFTNKWLELERKSDF